MSPPDSEPIYTENISLFQDKQGRFVRIMKNYRLVRNQGHTGKLNFLAPTKWGRGSR
jgi:hypothetical protein